MDHDDADGDGHWLGTALFLAALTAIALAIAYAVTS